MTKNFYTFPSTDQRTKIHAVEWVKDEFRNRDQKGVDGAQQDVDRKNAPRGVIQLIHGMVEHIARYDEFARFLAEQGFVVVGHDHLGHGQSVCSEEDYGFFCENQPALVLLQDIHRLRLWAKRRYPGLPYYMLGHSMGSYLLRRYLASQTDDLAGAIIVGTGFESEAKLTAGLAVLKMEAMKNGWRYRSERAEKLTFGSAYKAFDLTGEDLSRSWLSKNEENVRAYYSDPKCGFRFTLNGYWTLVSTVKFVCQKKNIEAIPKELPVLIISGEDDPVGNLGKGVKKTYNAFVKAGIEDVSCKLYPNDRHEILNETDRETVYGDILTWLEKHLEKKEEPEQEQAESVKEKPEPEQAESAKEEAGKPDSKKEKRGKAEPEKKDGAGEENPGEERGTDDGRTSG